jgi:uncharacterized protein (TIGR00730 family)
MKSLCIFCGSQHGTDHRCRAAAARLGELTAGAGLKVVYGGGRVGLMGAAADATMAAGGEVIGLIPSQLLEREVGHRAITELIVARDMFDRKDQMIARSDAFVHDRAGPRARRASPCLPSSARSKATRSATPGSPSRSTASAAPRSSA